MRGRLNTRSLRRIARSFTHLGNDRLHDPAVRLQLGDHLIFHLVDKGIGSFDTCSNRKLNEYVDQLRLIVWKEKNLRRTNS